MGKRGNGSATLISNWSEKQTDDPHYADEHNFYKVEAWSRDDQHIVVMLYAGSSLDRARDIFDSEVKRPIALG